MLDRAKAFLVGEAQVLHGDVVLHVEPGASGAGDVPEGGDRARSVLGFGQVMGGARRDADVFQRRRGGLGPAGQRRPGRERAGRGPGHRHAGGQVAPRHEGGDARVPCGAAALVTGQVNIRVPPARDRERAAFDLARAAIGEAQGDEGQPQPPARARHLRARQKLAIGLAARVGAGVRPGRFLAPLLGLGGRVEVRALALSMALFSRFAARFSS